MTQKGTKEVPWEDAGNKCIISPCVSYESSIHTLLLFHFASFKLYLIRSIWRTFFITFSQLFLFILSFRSHLHSLNSNNLHAYLNCICIFMYRIILFVF